MFEKGEFGLAVAWFKKAVERTPADAEAHQNLASALAAQGRLEEAIPLFQKALQLNPAHEGARSNLAAAVAQRQQWNQAESHYVAGADFLKTHQVSEAVAEFKLAVGLRPDWPEALNNLAWLLATYGDPQIRDGTNAVILAERACALTRETNVWMLSTLAAAYAEAGRFSEAIRTQEKTCSVGTLQHPDKAESFRQRLDLYRAQKPYRQP
jgi:Flp pilus assembly protein TadD